MAAAAPILTYTSLLGDRRRFARLQRVVEALSQCVHTTLPRALATTAAVKGAYRLFANRAVTPQAILQTARPDCLAKLAQEPRVLLIQDTTSLDFTAHQATTGLGPLGAGSQRGFLVHTALAATTTGVPLGLAAQQLWARDPAAVGLRTTRYTRQLEEKESGRWLTVAAASAAGIPATVETVTVADAEADIFGLFAAPRPATAHLLIRVAQQTRVLEDGQALGAAAAAAPVWGDYTVQVRASPTRQARTAHCRVRVLPVLLRPPHNQPAGRAYREPVPLTALWAEEVDPPPAGERPLHWLLLTSLPVESMSEAGTCLSYYSLRWLVERYHFVLKTGCGAERLQLREEARLERAVATACLVALRLLWLTYLAREAPEAPCTAVLQEAEWQALCVATSRQPMPPPSPPTLRQAVRLIAGLGGFLGRKGDGEPGPLTIWRGLTRLADLADMWQLMHAPPVTQCGEP